MFVPRKSGVWISWASLLAILLAQKPPNVTFENYYPHLIFNSSEIRNWNDLSLHANHDLGPFIHQKAFLSILGYFNETFQYFAITNIIPYFIDTVEPDTTVPDL